MVYPFRTHRYGAFIIYQFKPSPVNIVLCLRTYHRAQLFTRFNSIVNYARIDPSLLTKSPKSNTIILKSDSDSSTATYCITTGLVTESYIVEEQSGTARKCRGVKVVVDYQMWQHQCSVVGHFFHFTSAVAQVDEFGVFFTTRLYKEGISNINENGALFFSMMPGIYSHVNVHQQAKQNPLHRKNGKLHQSLMHFLL